MSVDYERTRGRRVARRGRTKHRILVAVAILVAFGVGIALGQALHDNPRPGEQTSEVTLPPLTKTSTP